MLGAEINAGLAEAHSKTSRGRQAHRNANTIISKTLMRCLALQSLCSSQIHCSVELGTWSARRSLRGIRRIGLTLGLRNHASSWKSVNLSRGGHDADMKISPSTPIALMVLSHSFCAYLVAEEQIRRNHPFLKFQV